MGDMDRWAISASRRLMHTETHNSLSTGKTLLEGNSFLE